MSLPEGPGSVPSVPHGRTAVRPQWPQLPSAVRRLVEERLRSPVVEAESQGSGFTPGFASRLTGADGSRLFVKAASKDAQAPFADAYREEARKLRLLPADLPAPALLWAHEDEEWVVLGFECVEGRPPRRPWRYDELGACLDLLEEVADVLEVIPDGLNLSPITSVLPGLLTGWDAIRTTSPAWPHLEQAAELAASFPGFPGNDACIHSDARDDNFLLRGEPAPALLCDWNWPTLGPRWLDTVDLLVSAHGDGLDADDLLVVRRLTRDVDPAHIDAWLAMLCGYMLQSHERPGSSSSPYLRAHARWWAAATWSWLARRRGW